MNIPKIAASAVGFTFFMVLFAHLVPATSESPSNLWEWFTISPMQFYRGHGLATEVVRVVITLAVWFLISWLISEIRAGAGKRASDGTDPA